MADSKVHLAPTSRKPPLTVERLRELLDYDPETGVFRWSDRCNRRGVRKGHRAGRAEKPSGRIVICIDYRNYPASRLAWLYVRGEWPNGLVDHKNRNPDDDRFSNLRDVDYFQSGWNRRAHKRNTSGFKGVTFKKQIGKWGADIVFRHKRYFLGYFALREDAATAYRVAAERLCGEFACCESYTGPPVG